MNDEVMVLKRELRKLKKEFADYIIRQQSVRYISFFLGMAAGAVPFAIPFLAWLNK